MSTSKQAREYAADAGAADLRALARALLQRMRCDYPNCQALATRLHEYEYVCNEHRPEFGHTGDELQWAEEAARLRKAVGE